MIASFVLAIPRVPMVKSAALPFGSTCGQRWLISSSPRVVRTSGSPPTALTRKRPEGGDGAKTIVSSGPQLAPRLRSTAQSVLGVPPLIGTFLSALRVTKPSQAPSGEKKGWYGASASVDEEMRFALS